MQLMRLMTTKLSKQKLTTRPKVWRRVIFRSLQEMMGPKKTKWKARKKKPSLISHSVVMRMMKEYMDKVFQIILVESNRNPKVWQKKMEEITRFYLAKPCQEKASVF